MKCESTTISAFKKGKRRMRVGWIWLHDCAVFNGLPRLSRFTVTKYQPTTATTLCRTFFHRTEMSFGRLWPSNDPTARCNACEEAWTVHDSS